MKRIKQIIFRALLAIAAIIAALVCLKALHTHRNMSNIGSFDTEKDDILRRSNYLRERLLVSPQAIIDAMPSSVGRQFQGEWAIYACSMYSRALVNIANLYPETKDEALETAGCLIEEVLSPEIRQYDADRWHEDPLESIGSGHSHISYFAHLAWMIGGYKALGGGIEYDSLYDDLCRDMSKNIENSPIHNVETYPGEVVYVPDMLVAIAALEQYSRTHNGLYHNTVRDWMTIMKERFTNKKTGLIMSYVSDYFDDSPLKGSYSAVNTYFLTQVDEDFARQQYECLKKYFFLAKPMAGVKEYFDKNCWFGMDYDAGPVIMNLSPSGTAFAIGPISYFGDNELRKSFLKSGEIAATTITHKEQSHYLLADIAIVGEAVVLAMRTEHPRP